MQNCFWQHYCYIIIMAIEWGASQPSASQSASAFGTVIQEAWDSQRIHNNNNHSNRIKRFMVCTGRSSWSSEAVAVAVLLSQLVVLSKGHQTARTEWIIMVVSLDFGGSGSGDGGGVEQSVMQWLVSYRLHVYYSSGLPSSSGWGGLYRVH